MRSSPRFVADLVADLAVALGGARASAPARRSWARPPWTIPRAAWRPCLVSGRIAAAPTALIAGGLYRTGDDTRSVRVVAACTATAFAPLVSLAGYLDPGETATEPRRRGRGG